MRAEVQAVVLGAGPGMRMTCLTSHTPKCLLPLATLPMITFPLHLLHQAGLTEATVVVGAAEESRVVKVVELTGPPIKVDSAPVNTSADPGTADSLRHIISKIKKSVDDVIIISSDLVTDARLQDVLDFHRARGSALTALVAPLRSQPHPQPAPGPKTKPSINSDVIVTEDGTGRMILVVAGGDYDDTVTLPALPAHSPAPLLASTALTDAHLYIVKRAILEEVLAKESPCRDMGSFKAEILPYIVSRQFTAQAWDAGCGEDYGDLVRRYNSSVVPSRYHSSTTLPPSACYVFRHPGLCLRVNTMAAYWDVNTRMHSLLEKILSGSPFPLHHPTAQIHDRAQVSGESVVGAGSVVCQKTSVSGCVLGNHCRVESLARLTNTVLGDHTTIASGCVVENSLVWDSVERCCVLRNCIVTDASKIQEGQTYTNEILEATQDFA